MSQWHLGLGVAIASLLSIGIAHSAGEAREPQIEKTAAVEAQRQTAKGLHVKDLKRPARTVKEWLAQVEAVTVTVTGVTVERTEAGLEIVLETQEGQSLQIDATKFTSEGNSLIATIPNAVLSLPNASEFSAENPTNEIANVRVTQVDASSIRVSVAGKDALPTQEVTLKTAGLAYSLNSEGETPEEELVVTGDRAVPYRVPNASTATRTDAPIRDIPASIQVIPQTIIRDQQITRFDEALRNVSGVIYGGADTTSEVRFSIRGFENAPVLIDGFRQFGFAEFLDPAGLEQIEVLKGPVSILYGEIQPGGVINAVTKKPLSQPFYEVELQGGSRNFFRPRIDFSGPLTADGKLLYRLNALVSTDDGFQAFDETYRNLYVAPVLTWKLSDRTDLTISLQYQKREKPFDLDDALAFGRGVLDLPRDRVLTEPDDDSVRKILNTGYTLEHRFSDDWLIRNAFRYTRNAYFSGKLTIPLSFDGTTGILSRVYALDDIESNDYSLQTYVVGKFATAAVKHTLLFGVDLNHSNTRFFGTSDFSTVTTINVFDPIYDPLPRPTLTALLLDTKVKTDRIGIYVQDQLTFADNFKVLLGLRYDALKQKTNTEVGIFTTGDDLEQSPDALTPRVGIVYQPIQPLSLYASYSRSFTPSDGALDESGNILEPEEGEGFEVGVKADLIRDRLFATLAFFDITKQNVATSDPRFPFGGISIATGEQRSQGIEFDLSGEILPGWNITASYAYTDAKVTQDNVTPIGNQLVGIPKHNINVWTTYTIQTGKLQGLGFGVGVNYVGEREGDLDNSFQLPSYFLTDAAIFYKRNKWRFAVNFKNLFNEKYYPGAPFGRTTGIAIGEPFTVIGSVSVQF